MPTLCPLGHLNPDGATRCRTCHRPIASRPDTEHGHARGGRRGLVAAIVAAIGVLAIILFAAVRSLGPGSSVPPTQTAVAPTAVAAGANVSPTAAPPIQAANPTLVATGIATPQPLRGQTPTVKPNATNVVATSCGPDGSLSMTDFQFADSQRIQPRAVRTGDQLPIVYTMVNRGSRAVQATLQVNVETTDRSGVQVLRIPTPGITVQPGPPLVVQRSAELEVPGTQDAGSFWMQGLLVADDGTICLSPPLPLEVVH